MLRRSSSAVATSREGHRRLPRSGWRASDASLNKFTRHNVLHRARQQLGVPDPLDGKAAVREKLDDPELGRDAMKRDKPDCSLCREDLARAFKGGNLCA